MSFEKIAAKFWGHLCILSKILSDLLYLVTAQSFAGRVKPYWGNCRIYSRFSIFGVKVLYVIWRDFHVLWRDFDGFFDFLRKQGLTDPYIIRQTCWYHPCAHLPGRNRSQPHPRGLEVDFTKNTKNFEKKKSWHDRHNQSWKFQMRISQELKGFRSS